MSGEMDGSGNAQPIDSMVFTGDELLHMKGQQAEEFYRFINTEPRYFLNLLAEMKDALQEQIMDLSPLETDDFVLLKASLDCLYAPIKRVMQDIEIGQIAWKRINGEPVDDTKGIL